MKLSLNIFITFTLAIFFFLPNNTNAQANWELAKDKNGIKVFTRKLPNANLKDYRVESVINATTNEVLDKLLDFEDYKNWFANTAQCYLIKQISDTELIQYFEAKAPWPVSNRDCYTRFKINRKANGDITINLSLAPEYYEENSSIIHIPRFEGYWKITKINNNQVNVIQQISSDPGGEIPDWLANAFIVDTPFTSFSNLKKAF